MTLEEILNQVVNDHNDEDFLITSLYGRIQTVGILWHFNGVTYQLCRCAVLHHLLGHDYDPTMTVTVDQDLGEVDTNALRQAIDDEKNQIRMLTKLE